MKLKKDAKGFVYEFDIPQLLTDRVADVFCYLVRLEGVDDNIDFRRTFCSKTVTINKEEKRTSYKFIAPKPGIYELGQMYGNSNYYRKFYYILKRTGSFEFISKQVAIDELKDRTDKLRLALIELEKLNPDAGKKRGMWRKKKKSIAALTV